MRSLLTALCVVFISGCATVPAFHDTDPFPGDGNLTNAVELELDNIIADRVGPTAEDRTDWKSLSVRSPTRVRVVFVAAGALELVMYEEDGAHVGTLTGRGGQEQVFVATLRGGRYLLEVNARAEVNPIDYTLLVEIVP